MTIKNPKFVCLECFNKFEKKCKHIAVDHEKKHTECDDTLLACNECHSELVIPFETRKYKLVVECEYSLDVSPVENDSVHSETDGTDEEILKDIIGDSLEGTARNYHFLSIEKIKKAK